MNVKRRLRLTRAAVDIQYSDGDYSNNLVGTDFALQGNTTATVLSVDLSSNFRTRHGESNSFLDAEEFARKPASLESVHIADAQIAAGIAAQRQQNPNSRWRLELDLGEGRVFTYSVQCIADLSHVTLQVLEKV